MTEACDGATRLANVIACLDGGLDRRARADARGAVVFAVREIPQAVDEIAGAVGVGRMLGAA